MKIPPARLFRVGFFCGLLVAGALRGSESVRDVTPVSLPDAEAFVYQETSGEPLRLHVFKPPGWRPSDRRAALVIFFGGDWTYGTPREVAAWTRWAAASLGLVGIAPDYRTATRFGTAPADAVADARAAMRWIEAHATELGVDPRRIVAGGHSAGGLLALWTGIAHGPPALKESADLPWRAAAIVLTSAVSDTSPATGYTPERFGAAAEDFSAAHRLVAPVPPILAFHGDADRIVPYIQATRLKDAVKKLGGTCELVTVKGGTHNFGAEMPEWRDRIRARLEEFLRKQKLLPQPAGR